MQPASAEDKTFAEFFSIEQYDEAILDGIWTEKDALEYLTRHGYWSEEKEEQMKQAQEAIENMKVDYFNNFYSSDSKKYIKMNLKKQQERQAELSVAKNAFYDKTCDYIKYFAYSTYLINKNAFLSSGKLASSCHSPGVLIKNYNNICSNIASNTRKIAKSTEWRQRWSSLKDKIFSNEQSSLTDLQLSMLSWSSYYDGVNQSMDRPPDVIIEDDIALDGWAIKERRKREQEEKQRDAEKLLPANMKDANEVFLPARNAKQAQDIASLNSIASKKKIESLKKDLESKGTVREEQLTSTKRELQMQAVRNAQEKRRR